MAAVSLVLAGIGATVLSQLTVDSGYFERAFWGLLVFGAGLGAGTVAGSTTALSGVAEHDSGVASGVQNASFQIGGALGIAVLSAVSVAHSTGTSAVGLTAGYRVAFATCWAFIAVGLAGTGMLISEKRVVAQPVKAALDAE